MIKRICCYCGKEFGEVDGADANGMNLTHGICPICQKVRVINEEEFDGFCIHCIADININFYYNIQFTKNKKYKIFYCPECQGYTIVLLCD